MARNRDDGQAAPSRRKPSTLGGVAYLILVAVTAVGLAVVAFGPWRRGIAIVGGGFVLAAVARAFLPENDAGMLRVRRRWFDLALMLGLGIAMLVLARVVPNQPS